VGTDGRMGPFSNLRLLVEEQDQVAQTEANHNQVPVMRRG
jgi:hypothetical protein